MIKPSATGTAEPAHAQIRRHFQQSILCGDLKAGDRIPPTRELARQWGLSCTAVQRALASLTAAGMLTRARRRGTFVSQGREEGVIGIIIGPCLAEESCHYYRVLLRALQEKIFLQKDQRNWSVLSYDGLTSAPNSQTLSGAAQRRRLFRDLENDSFKGLIEIASGVSWSGEVRRRTELPIVNHLEARFDMTSFWRHSLDLVRKTGRKNAAFIQIQRPSDEDESRTLKELARECGLPVPQVVNVLVSGSPHQRAETVHQQMLQCLGRWRSGPKETRPEALIVSDDIAMRSVGLALTEASIQIPDDMLVVSMASEGVHLYYGVPVVRYEFSPKEQARALLELLWGRIMKSSDPVLPILLPGRFADSH